MSRSISEDSDLPDPARARALEVFRSARSFLLTGHQRPDGDCIGAQAALARILQARGAVVHVLNPDPPEARYAYLSREVEYGAYEPGLELPEHEVCVLLDCSELSRCGALADPLAARPSRKLVIDHHPHPEAEWWDEAYRDVSASATGLLVYRIAHSLALPLDEVARQGIFTSMVTDTGWFKYSNTDPETLRVAADLIAGGISPDGMYRAIYQQKSAQHPLELARALGRTSYHADGRLALIDLPLAGASSEPPVDSDDALDLLRSVSTVEVVLFLREVEPGRWKLSARSKTDFDVNRLARAFGGGGHAKAAGATLEGSFQELRDGLIARAVQSLLVPEVARGEQRESAS